MSHFPVSASASPRGRLQRWCSGLTEDSESGHALFRVAAVGLVRRTRGFLRLLRGKSEFSQYLFFKISLAFLLQFV